MLGGEGYLMTLGHLFFLQVLGRVPGQHRGISSFKHVGLCGWGEGYAWHLLNFPPKS
jgi:hypothetical protein